MSTEKKKRKMFSILEKLDIIAEIESGSSQAVVARHRQVPKTTVQTIWKDREKIRQNGTIYNLEFKRARRCEFEDVDKEVLHWFNVQRGRHIPISGPILKGAAEEIAKKLGTTDFRASEGWLDRWKKRHGVVFKTAAGESAAVDVSALDSWLQDVWPALSRGYHANDIFNVDETGLFYRLLPNKTLDFKGNECHGGKQRRERLTVLLCTNATGTDKLVPLVIGSSARPRCFKNIRDLNSLPVKYESNKRAWMTTQIFAQWLKKVELQMKLAGRKILLLMDNCTPHVAATPKLENVKVVFLPPNTTSVGQPLDRGIINSFKIHYRKNLVRKLVARMDHGLDYKIDVLEAIMGIKSAWDSVTSDCIHNCFVNAKITPPGDDYIADETPINLEGEMTSAAAGNVDFMEYVNVDQNIILCDEDYSRARSDSASPQNERDQIIFDDNYDSEEIEREKVSRGAACEMIEQLKYFIACEGGDGALLTSAVKIEHFILSQILASKKQSKITDFFGEVRTDDSSVPEVGGVSCLERDIPEMSRGVIAAGPARPLSREGGELEASVSMMARDPGGRLTPGIHLNPADHEILISCESSEIAQVETEANFIENEPEEVDNFNLLANTGDMFLESELVVAMQGVEKQHSGSQQDSRMNMNLLDSRVSCSNDRIELTQLSGSAECQVVSVPTPPESPRSGVASQFPNFMEESSQESQEILPVMIIDDDHSTEESPWSPQWQNTLEKLTAIGVSNKNGRLRRLIQMENGDLGNILGKITHESTNVGI